MLDTLVAIPNSQDTMPSLFFDSLMEMNLPNCQIKRFNKFPVDLNREQTIKYFLENKNFRQLLWLDTDMVHPTNLLQVLESFKQPVISGLYFEKTFPFHPIMFSEPQAGIFQKYANWPEMTLLEVGSMGTGCLLVQREVFEKISYPYCFYSRSEHDNTCPIGEDTNLFTNIKNAGFKLFVYTGVVSYHIKQEMITPEIARQALRTVYRG